MPTYTDPDSGKKIVSKEPLSNAELEEAFGGIKKPKIPLKDILAKQTPPTEEPGMGESFLKELGAPTSEDELKDSLIHGIKNVALGGIDPFMGINAIKGMVSASGERAKKYFNRQADDNSVGSAAQTMMAGVPGVGRMMENADEAIPPSGPLNANAIARLAANAATIAVPEMAERLPAGLASLDRFSGNLPGMASDVAVAGAKNLPIVGKNVKGFVRDLKNARSLRTPMEATPLEDVAPITPDPRVAELKDLTLNRKLAQEKGLLPQGDSALDPSKVDELKRLKLQNSLAKQREIANATEDNSDGGGNSSEGTDSSTPIAKTKSPLNDVEKLFKEVKKRIKGTPPPALKDIPTAPNPSSQIVPHDPEAQVSSENPNTSRSPLEGLTTDLNPDILRQYASHGEVDQMVETDKVRQLQPETHEEWQQVNDLEAKGMDRTEAMRAIRDERLKNASENGNPLNSRQFGTNPRSLGVDRRTRGVSPRALENMRKEP